MPPSTEEQIQKILEKRFSRANSMPVNEILVKLKNRHDFDQVYPRIFIGNSGFAKSPRAMREAGITHCLNMAEGTGYLHVDTNQAFYDKYDIKYMGVQADDKSGYDLKQHFDEAVEFIHKCLNENDSNAILVHCLMGISRSTTTVVAYLMKHKCLSAHDALKHVRDNRHVHPNAGFVKQLVEYGNTLDNDIIDEKC